MSPVVSETVMSRTPSETEETDCRKLSTAAAPVATSSELCDENSPKVPLVICVEPCGQDQSCIAACANKHPTGAQVFGVYADCLLCKNCYNDCDGKSGGCK